MKKRDPDFGARPDGYTPPFAERRGDPPCVVPANTNFFSSAQPIALVYPSFLRDHHRNASGKLSVRSIP